MSERHCPKRARRKRGSPTKLFMLELWRRNTMRSTLANEGLGMALSVSCGGRGESWNQQWRFTAAPFPSWDSIAMRKVLSHYSNSTKWRVAHGILQSRHLPQKASLDQLRSRALPKPSFANALDLIPEPQTLLEVKQGSSQSFYILYTRSQPLPILTSSLQAFASAFGRPGRWASRPGSDALRASFQPLSKPSFPPQPLPTVGQHWHLQPGADWKLRGSARKRLQF